jgi:hypothetical protein
MKLNVPIHDLPLHILSQTILVYEIDLLPKIGQNDGVWPEVAGTQRKPSYK